MPEFGLPLEIGKGRIVREGNVVALLSLGTRLADCLGGGRDARLAWSSATVAERALCEAAPMSTWCCSLRASTKW